MSSRGVKKDTLTGTLRLRGKPCVDQGVNSFFLSITKSSGLGFLKVLHKARGVDSSKKSQDSSVVLSNGRVTSCRVHLTAL